MVTLALFRPDANGPDRLTVRDVLDLYLRHSRAQNLHGAAALADREYVFGLFCGVCGDVPADEAKPYHLTDFIEAQPTWKSSSTRRAKVNYVKAAFNWAFEQERIPRNPFRKNPYPEAERRPDMPEAAIERVEAVSNKPFERVIRFLRLTGCRTGELCAAVWADMDLERGTWTIHRHKTRKHTGKPKIVALVPEAVDLLRGLESLARTAAVTTQPNEAFTGRPAVGSSQVAANAYVFLNTRNKPWQTRTLAAHLRLLKRRGQVTTDATLHGVRHRAASAAIAAGAPIKLVAQQLGHASVRTTEAFYCDLTGEIDAIRDAFGKGLPK